MNWKITYILQSKKRMKSNKMLISKKLFFVIFKVNKKLLWKEILKMKRELS